MSIIWQGQILGQPITKKNSQRIITINGHPSIMPSKQYKDYEAEALRQLKPPASPIETACTVECRYWLVNARKGDLTNYLESTHDILVKAKVLADDNYSVITSVDGSRVMGKDKELPRVEIIIKEYEPCSD